MFLLLLSTAREIFLAFPTQLGTSEPWGQERFWQIRLPYSIGGGTSEGGQIMPTTLQFATIFKGQLIPKGNFGVFNSSRKRT